MKRAVLVDLRWGASDFLIAGSYRRLPANPSGLLTLGVILGKHRAFAYPCVDPGVIGKVDMRGEIWHSSAGKSSYEQGPKGTGVHGGEI